MSARFFLLTSFFFNLQKCPFFFFFYTFWEGNRLPVICNCPLSRSLQKCLAGFALVGFFWQVCLFVCFPEFKG